MCKAIGAGGKNKKQKTNKKRCCCVHLYLYLSSLKSFSFLSKTKPLSFNGVLGSPAIYRFKAFVDVPDFLFVDWYAFDSEY